MTLDLTFSDVQNILKIIDASEHLDEVEIIHNGFELRIARSTIGATLRPRPAATAAPVAAPPSIAAAAAPPPTPAAAAKPLPPLAAAAQAAVPPGIIAIRAPMLGTFYRSPAPGEKPFVEKGQRVRADDTVCLIEVMKLFNSIRAGVDGEIADILVENGGLIEFDQPLIFLKPAG